MDPVPQLSCQTRPSFRSEKTTGVALATEDAPFSEELSLFSSRRRRRQQENWHSGTLSLPWRTGGGILLREPRPWAVQCVQSIAHVGGGSGACLGSSAKALACAAARSRRQRRDQK